MKKLKKNLYGASLIALAFSLNISDAFAQTCAVPPTCAQLGYTKSASDCGGLATLKCPFDDSKLFCTAYTDQNGNKVAEIGDFVYTDAISAEPISGRIPVGIVYDLSGKMMSIAEYGNTDKCGTHSADSVTGWTLASIEDMSMIKNQVSIINASLAKLSGAPQISTKTYNSYTHVNCYYVGSNLPGTCMEEGTAIGSSNSGGCYQCSSTSNYAQKSRCVRTFSSNGAGGTNTPSATYAVGSEYKDSSGTIIGTVITINATGDHGTIINRISRSSIRDEAITYCTNLKTGGLTWSLPSFEHMANACTVKAAGYSQGNKYWIHDSGYFYQSRSYEACNDIDNNGSSTAGTYEHFCVGTF